MWQLPKITPDEILIYLRKSRADDPLLTVAEVLERHEERLDEWVERNLPGMGKVPEVNRYREVVSGETIDSRPKMLEVLRQLEDKRYKALLVVEPSRLSRGDLEDIGRLVKLLRYSDTLVLTMHEMYDLNDKRDREYFERELMRGNDYLEYQKKIMGAGRLQSVQEGYYLGQHAPYGYRKVTYKDGKKTCHTLEPDPETAPIVKQIFEWYRDGYGCNTLREKLHEIGARPLNGAKYWAHTTLRNILGNEHYLGKIVWYRKKTIREVRGGEVVERRPYAEEYLVFEGKHPAIIDQELFDAVQAKRGLIPRKKKNEELMNPLAGLLYCRTCGLAMARHGYKYKGVERAAARYMCRHQKQCDNASSTCADVLEEVKRVLREAIEDFEVRIEAGADDSAEVHRQMVERLEKRLADLEELEAKQWAKYTEEGMPKAVFDKLNGRTVADKEEVQAALCAAKDAMPEPVDYEAKVTTFRAALEMMGDPDAPIKELNELLKTCVDRIEYSRPKTQSAHARWTTAAPIVLDITLRV